MSSYKVINSYRIFALLCLKNCKNLGMSIFNGLLTTSLSRASAESSQIFCIAPKAPYNKKIKKNKKFLNCEKRNIKASIMEGKINKING